MKNSIINKDISLIQRSMDLDNPVLRHFVKIHSLSRLDTTVLGVLLELTGQRQSDIRTHYNVIASQAGISDMEAYQSINSLHRYRIIDAKPVENLIHISFNEIEEKIDEIDLANQNARKIKKLESEVSYMKAKNYVPSDELFDILMPLIGRIIAKKVTEALSSLVNYINSKIDSATSIKLWKYKFQSFRTGIPVAEIMLRNSLPYLVEEILLIDKKSSVLISNASLKEAAGADRDIVAAMLTAVTDFIRTSFRKEKSSINEISFGDSKILVFGTLYFYSAILVYGHPATDFFNSTDSLLNSIHLKFRDKLKKFKGNMRGLEPIRMILSDFIIKSNTQNDIKQENKSPCKMKIIAGLCSAVIIILLVFFIAGEIRDYRLEKKILNTLDTSLPLYSHDLQIDADGNTLTVTGTVSSPDTAEAIKTALSSYPEIKNLINKTVSADYRTVEKFKNDIIRFEEKFDSLELLYVKQELEKIIIEFPSGVSSIGDNQVLQIKKVYELIKNYPDIEADIIAFNDPAGGLDVNRKLAQARMEAIRNYLSNLGINTDRIHITDFNPDVINADPRYKGYKNTRGIMMFARRNTSKNL